MDDMNLLLVGGAGPSALFSLSFSHQTASSAAANPFTQGQQQWIGYGGWLTPQQSQTFMPRYSANQGQSQLLLMGQQHGGNAFSPGPLTIWA